MGATAEPPATLTGYAHPLYASSLAEFGTPLELPSSRGWLLQRSITGTMQSDAMGLYPIFCCPNWNGLHQDLQALSEDLVSVVLVADPFGSFDETLLHSCFDRVLPFKKHFVVDLEKGDSPGSSHHRYYAKKALRDVTVEVCAPSEAFLTEWITLYGHLIQRHSLTGIQAFSDESFRRQFAVPGLIVLRALDRSGECVGAHLWYVQGEVAFSHLAAASELGYRLSCLYALYDAAIRYFRGQVRWLDLGGGAGLSASSDGLTKFKEGWANTDKTALLCGRILNPHAYQQLSLRTPADTQFFPAYRHVQAS